MKWVVIGVTVMIWNSISCQDLGFPTDEEKPHVSNGHAVIINPKPLYLVKECPENMILIPGPSDDQTTWKCGCPPIYLFFPPTNSCVQAYTRGPCAAGDHVVLPKNEIVAKCVPNPCTKEGEVPYNGTCYRLRAADGPCGSNEKLDINDTTFEIECVPLGVTYYNIIRQPPRPCPPGTQLDATGVCRDRVYLRHV